MGSNGTAGARRRSSSTLSGRVRSNLKRKTPSFGAPDSGSSWAGVSSSRKRVRRPSSSVSEAWNAAGYNPSDLAIGTHYHVVVGEDGAEALHTAGQATVHRIQATYDAQALSTASAWGGYEDFSVDQLVADGRIIAGSPEECASQIRRVESEVGIGSTFHVTLPRHRRRGGRSG